MIRHIYLLAKSTRMPAMQQIYNPFSTNKIVYKPMLPFTQKYNAIYINQQYSKGIITSPRSTLIYWIPAAGLFINNYLTEWNFTNSVGFATLLLAGSLMRFAYKQLVQSKVQCLQVDSQLKWVYITAKNAQILGISKARYFLPPKQLQMLINSYHPMNEKNQAVNIQQARETISLKQQNRDENKQKIRKFEEKTSRCRIPIDLIQFEMNIPQKQLPEFERDKQRLSPKQMFKKYENYPITLKHTFKKDTKQFPVLFEIDTKDNVQKKHHDYLLALTLGYQIDTTGVPKFPEDPLQQQIQKQLKQNTEVTEQEQFVRLMKILEQNQKQKQELKKNKNK